MSHFIVLLNEQSSKISSHSTNTIIATGKKYFFKLFYKKSYYDRVFLILEGLILFATIVKLGKSFKVHN